MLNVVDGLIKACERERSFAPALPIFKISGNPMNLDYHFQLAPFFAYKRPERSTKMVARQLGKSFSLSGSANLRSGFIPYYHTIIVQPRFDQISRFHNSIMKPMLNSVSSEFPLIDRVEANKFNMRTFKNGSILYLEFAFLSPDRLRGITGVSELVLDEVQDIDWDFIPIMEECMSATMKYGILTYSGTPKTTDGTLGMAWERSSQAEWVIPCKACNKTNIPSIKHDILKMIGKTTVCCAKCGKPLDARNGWYEHAIPSRMHSWEGHHVSQVIHPFHYTLPRKWNKLLLKMENYTKSKFYNEVLGEPCDESTRLLGLQDLVSASNNYDNSREVAMNARKYYTEVILGIDWTGGGELEQSHTAGAIVGCRPGTDVLDCLYAFRIRQGTDPFAEVRQILQIFHMFKCSLLAHDYSGAGSLREAMLVQSGLPSGAIVPISYVGPNMRPIMHYEKAIGGARSSYSLDKARSLAILTTIIRNRKISLPKFPVEQETHVIRDLLNLVERPKELPSGGQLYLIGRKPGLPDDFAHALNYACSAIWKLRREYPQLADLSRYMDVDPEELRIAEGVNRTEPLDWK